MSRRRLPHIPPYSLLFGLSLVAVLAVLHGGWIPDWLENAGKDGWYTDDVRNLLGYFVYAEPEAFHDDLIGAYSRAQSPFAHHLLVAFFAKLGLLRELTQYGPAVVWAVAVALAARCGACLGGWPAAVLAATLVLVTPVYPQRIAGLLPRALCFPCVFWFAEGLLRARPKRAATAVVALAAFYPTVGAALGFGLAGWLLVFAPRVGPRWALGGRLKLVAAAGGLAVLTLVPTLWGLSEFGATTSHLDWETYPEAGPGGIAGPGDRWPWRGILEELRLLQSGLVDDQPFWEGPRRALGDPLFTDTALYAALGLTALRARRDRRARRLLLLGLTALFGHWITRVFYPLMYAPTRALQYVWPPFFLLAVVAGTAELARPVARGARGLIRRALERWGPRLSERNPRLARWAKRELGPFSARLAVFGLVLAAISGYGSSSAGFVFRRPEAELSLERFVAGLPPETLVAGWPDDPMSNLAWVSGRQVFMTGEMHIPHHVGYLEQLRPRLFDFFDAYLAHDPQEVLAFAEQYGVTHFMIDTRHFGPQSPRYMPPFGPKVAERHRESLRKGGFALARLAPQATVASRGPLRIVSVARLREALESAG